MKKNTVVLAASTALALCLLGGLAWACTPSRYLVLSPTFAESPRPSSVTVTGNDFVPDVAVEIRWNTVKGPELGRAEGPNFSTSVQIPPDAKTDTYYIVGVQRDPSGTVISKTAAVFDLKPGGRSGSGASPDVQPLGDLWSGFAVENDSPAQEGFSTISPKGPPSSSPSNALAVGLAGVGFAGLLASVFILLDRKRRLGRASGN